MREAIDLSVEVQLCYAQLLVGIFGLDQIVRRRHTGYIVV